MKKNHIPLWKIPQKFRKRIMRYSLLLTLLLSFIIQAGASAQKISVRVEAGSLDEAFQQIIGQSKVQLVYNTGVASAIHCAGAEFTNKEINEILETLLAGTGLTYKAQNGIYMISQKIPAGQQQKTATIRGKVTNTKGEPLPGVTIRVKGTTVGVVSDNDGNYRFAIPATANPVLVFSFVGMQSQEVEYTGQWRINIIMHEDVSEMEEVVVTGYQTINREKVTGSTTTVSSEDLSRQYSPNIMDRLEGRVAGLVNYDGKTLIRGTSSLYAETSPLLVVDGLPIEGKIEDLNPYDIESVTVLKDAAAAAIYGARASNGIIVITTKKAKKTGSTEIDVSANLTVYEKRNLDYADNFYMTPAQQVDKESEYYQYYFSDENPETDDPIGLFEESITDYKTITPLQWAYYQHAKGIISESELEEKKNELKKNNFAKEFSDHVLRKRILQQYNLAIRNRTEKFNSNLVFNLRRDNNGIVKSYDNQINISYRCSYDMKPWLTVDFGFNGILSKTKESASQYATDPFNVPSYYRLLNDDGSYNYYSPDFFNDYNTIVEDNPGLRSMHFNHLEELDYDQTTTDRRNMRYQGGLIFKVIDGLTVNTQFIYETERRTESTYSEAESYSMRLLRNIYTLRKGTAPDYTYEYMLPENGGRLATVNTRGEYWTARAQLNFRRTLAEKHAIDFLAGLEFRETRNGGTRGLLLGYDEQLQSQATTNVSFTDLYNYEKTTFFLPSFPARSWGYEEYIQPYIGLVRETQHRYASGYANITYTYDNRFNVFASFRKDYADLFGANTEFRGKPLWSVGASWNLYNETFLRSVTWLNNLKLRTSYGITGNIYQGATSYLTASTGGLNSYTKQPTATVSSPANPELKWEKTATYNLGLDFALFGHRLRGSLDWYNKKGSDIFSKKSLDVSKGFTSINMNLADMTNNGVELALSYNWFRESKPGDFGWSTSVTMAYNKNKITYMEVQATTAYSLISSGFQIGYPTSAMFSYRHAGLDDQGQPLWWTADGRKTASITNESVNSVVYSGQADPKINAAMENTLRYKGFSLNFMMVYYGGHKMRVRQYNQTFTLPFGAVPDYYVNSWTPENKDTNVPGVGQYGAKSIQNQKNEMTDIYVQPADFLKIRNIVLGYDVPKGVIRHIGLNNLQVRFQIDNPRALWQKNDVKVDPETKGIRRPTSYIFGLNFNF